MTLDSKLENHKPPSVGIVKTTPKVSEKKLFSHRRCYMGISLENPVFQGEALEALLQWMTEKFDQSLVVVGDHLTRYNEQIFAGLDSDEAEKKAHSLGDAFILETHELFENIPSEKIHLTRWKSHLQTQQYTESKEKLDNLFASDEDFRASIRRDAFSFVTRQKKQDRKVVVQTEQAIHLSSKYLLEEIAVFSSLSRQGWHVELYPGPELRVLVDIANGKYFAVPEGLKERINVELRLGGKASNRL